MKICCKSSISLNELKIITENQKLNSVILNKTEGKQWFLVIVKYEKNKIAQLCSQQTSESHEF